jgi:hypothetical protein
MEAGLFDELSPLSLQATTASTTPMSHSQWLVIVAAFKHLATFTQLFYPFFTQ